MNVPCLTWCGVDVYSNLVTLKTRKYDVECVESATFAIACGIAAPGNAFPPLPPLAPEAVPMKRLTKDTKSGEAAFAK